MGLEGIGSGWGSVTASIRDFLTAESCCWWGWAPTWSCNSIEGSEFSLVPLWFRFNVNESWNHSENQSRRAGGAECLRAISSADIFEVGSASRPFLTKHKFSDTGTTPSHNYTIFTGKKENSSKLLSLVSALCEAFSAPMMVSHTVTPCLKHCNLHHLSLAVGWNLRPLVIGDILAFGGIKVRTK